MTLHDLEKLQKKIHTEIPMTKLMKLSLDFINEDFLLTKAPLEENINDKGSGFGGSLSSITIISSWCLSKLIADNLGFKNCDILIIKNETVFTKQITKDIVCKVNIPSKEEIQIVKEKILSKGSASLKINANIVQDDESCMNFKGVYVIKNKD